MGGWWKERAKEGHQLPSPRRGSGLVRLRTQVGVPRSTEVVGDGRGPYAGLASSSLAVRAGPGSGAPPFRLECLRARATQKSARPDARWRTLVLLKRTRAGAFPCRCRDVEGAVHHGTSKGGGRQRGRESVRKRYELWSIRRCSPSTVSARSGRAGSDEAGEPCCTAGRPLWRRRSS